MSPRVVTETQETTNIERQMPQKVVKTTTQVVPEGVGEETPQKTYQTKKAIFRTYQVLFYILGLIEILLAFRLLLKLMGASQASGFTDFIYAISGPFATPFLGIVRTTVSGNSI